MKVIGFTGKKESGKTLAANLVVDMSDACILNFADKLKEHTAHLFNVPFDKFIHRKEELHPIYNLTYRQLLQQLGDFTRGIYPDFWIKKFELDFSIINEQFPIDLLLIPDIRFDNEANWVHKRGGLVIDIHRYDETIDSRISERGISPKLINFAISNEGTKKELKDRLEFALKPYLNHT